MTDWQSEPFLSVIVPAYNPGASLQGLVEAMAGQQFDRPIELLVVDDASLPPVRLPACGPPGLALRLLRQEQRGGRAATRNAGASSARGELLLFLDVDCVPSTREFVELHVEAVRNGEVASCGSVRAAGKAFWDRYQNAAASRREEMFRSGLACAGSAANLLVRRDAFLAIGGFDTGYRSYGFEDRDLLARLAGVGSVAWAEGATVIHRAVIRLGDVAAKLALAGQETAPLFSARHPVMYRRLGYAAIDARLRPWLRPVGRLLGPAALALATPVERVLDRKWMPFGLARSLAKAIGAMSFLYGTTRAGTQQG